MARTRFHTMLDVRLREVLVDREEQLTSGGVSSYDAYRYNVGYIRGVRDALKVADEVNEDLDK